MSSEAKFWALAVCCGTLLFISMMVAGTAASISERNHKYRMAQIKCQPSNTDLKGGE